MARNKGISNIIGQGQKLLKKKEIDSAIKLYNEAYDSIQKMENPRKKFDAGLAIADSLVGAGLFEESKKYYELVLEASSILGDAEEQKQLVSRLSAIERKFENPSVEKKWKNWVGEVGKRYDIPDISKEAEKAPKRTKKRGKGGVEGPAVKKAEVGGNIEEEAVAIDPELQEWKGKGSVVEPLEQVPEEPEVEPGDETETPSLPLKRRAAPTTKIVKDTPTSTDTLGYDTFARAVATLITHKETKPPLTIGIKAPWGAGKSSTMIQIRDYLDNNWKKKKREGGRPGSGKDFKYITYKELRNLVRAIHSEYKEQEKRQKKQLKLERAGRLTKFIYNIFKSKEIQEEKRARSTDKGEKYKIPPRITVWFNVWKYQSDEQIWAAMADNIITQLTDRMEPEERELFWLKFNKTDEEISEIQHRINKVAWKRVPSRFLPWPVMCSLAAGAAYFGFGLEVIIAQIVALLGPAIGIVHGYSVKVKELDKEIDDTFKDVLSKPDYKGKMGFLHFIENDVKKALERAAEIEKISDENPLVIFLDDLDRCAPHTVADVVDAINLFLSGDFDKCIFVIGMEPSMVAAAIEAKNEDVINKIKEASLIEEPVSLGIRFTNKIIQLPLVIPQPTEMGIKEFTHSMLDLPSPTGKGKENIEKFNKYLTENAKDLDTLEEQKDWLLSEYPLAKNIIDQISKEMRKNMYPIELEKISSKEELKALKEELIIKYPEDRDYIENACEMAEVKKYYDDFSDHISYDSESFYKQLKMERYMTSLSRARNLDDLERRTYRLLDRKKGKDSDEIIQASREVRKILYPKELEKVKDIKGLDAIAEGMREKFSADRDIIEKDRKEVRKKIYPKELESVKTLDDVDKKAKKLCESFPEDSDIIERIRRDERVKRYQKILGKEKDILASWEKGIDKIENEAGKLISSIQESDLDEDRKEWEKIIIAEAREREKIKIYDRWSIDLRYDRIGAYTNLLNEIKGSEIKDIKQVNKITDYLKEKYENDEDEIDEAAKNVRGKLYDNMIREITDFKQLNTKAKELFHNFPEIEPEIKEFIKNEIIKRYTNILRPLPANAQLPKLAELNKECPENNEEIAEASKQVYSKVITTDNLDTLRILQETDPEFLSNPRQTKRYLNLLRFMLIHRHFISSDKFLQDEDMPSDETISKFVQLNILWPQTTDYLREKRKLDEIDKELKKELRLEEKAKVVKNGKMEERVISTLAFMEVKAQYLCDRQQEGEINEQTANDDWDSYLKTYGWNIQNWEKSCKFRKVLGKKESIGRYEGMGLW